MTRRATTLEEHLSPEQVAERLNVSLSTVRRLIRSGRTASSSRAGIWPVVRIGACTRIPASAVLRFLESRTLTSAQPEEASARG